MTAVNLIPQRRLHARRMRMRVRLWAGVTAAWAAALVIAHVWAGAAWEDDSPALVAAIAKADAEIQELERSTAAGRVALAEAQATLRARKAVGDQPDWGLLLATLAARLDQQAVLSACILEPAGAQVTGRGSAAAADAQRRMIRPSHYKLTLTGLTRKQDTASAIAIALERTKLFDHVTLLEARRSGFLGEEAVTFRLECALVDPAAEVQ